jgi:FtsZ-binding cell division protein ZapB
MPFEKELQNTREHLQNCIADNNKLKEQLQQAQEAIRVNEGKVKSF